MSSLLFLGTGASNGVPVIGCSCEVCQSKSPFNKRFRSSALIKTGDKRILIDAGPDLRMQALHHHINHLDGVIFTHAHQDHTAGIDDLRVYTFIAEKSLPCLASEETAKELQLRYYFMFEAKHHEKSRPRLEIVTLNEDKGETEFQGLKLKYFTYVQLGMKVNGFRFGNLAYLTDVEKVNDALIKEVEGVDTLILSALRHTHSIMHLTVDQAVDFAHKVGAKKTYLTHLSHDLDYQKTNTILPEDVRLAYDSLEIPFTAN